MNMTCTRIVRLLCAPQPYKRRPSPFRARLELIPELAPVDELVSMLCSASPALIHALRSDLHLISALRLLHSLLPSLFVAFTAIVTAEKPVMIACAACTPLMTLEGMFRLRAIRSRQ